MARCHYTSALAASEGCNIKPGADGNNAAVAAASRDIGRVIAEGLAVDGCNLHVVYRARDAFERAARQIQSPYQVSVTAHALDRTTIDNVRTLLDAAGGAENMVNKAGAIPAGDLQMIDQVRWRSA